MTDAGLISRREWQRVILFASVVMLVTTLPYVIGWLSEGDQWQFGGFLFGVEDGYSYLAKMRLGARGDWLFTIRYTAEPHQGALLFLPYILLGKLTGLFVSTASPDLPTALAVTFHIAQALCGFLLILVSYRFVAVFLRRPGSRLLALVLIALGGGLGWLLAILGLGHLFGSLPVDFYVPEGYSFLILFGLPHLALARSAMLVGFLLMSRAVHVPGPPRLWLRWTLLAGLSWIVMGLCVPFYIAVVYLILGSWGLAAWIRWRRFPWAPFWRATSAGLVVLPLLLYNSLVFATDDVLRQWSAQNQLPSPNPLHYVFGYGVLAVPAVAALRWAWRKGAPEHGAPYLLLAAWLVMVPVAVYLPINVQRRLAEGVIVPLSILAVAGLRLMVPHRRQWKRAQAALLLLALPTSALLWLGGTFSALRPDRPLFHPRVELSAMDTLNQVAPRDAVVLCLKETGNYLPARTDLKAYVGHGPETLNAKEKETLAEQLFAGDLDAEARRSLLSSVDYVFFGPLEQEHSGANRSWIEGLTLLAPFAPDDPVVVYEVPHD
ncbi:MAG TPA: hypothetical protein VMT24_02570 [Aggregatilineaceae bacterium]|nr:hypothetical protein [Aggregatilineaceae bacterium]